MKKIYNIIYSTVYNVVFSRLKRIINAIYRSQGGGVPQVLSQVSQQLFFLGTVYCIVQCPLYTKVYTTLYTVHYSVR